MATYKNDLISVGGHEKNTDLHFFLEHLRFFCSHNVLPTKMTYENLFIFAFLESSHSGWPRRLDTIFRFFLVPQRLA